MTTVMNVVTFACDSAGEETLAADFSGTYTMSYSMSYNADGEVTAVSEPFGASLTFSYDADGERTLVQDNFGGVQTSTYDSDGELTALAYSGQGQAALAEFTYYADGNLDTITRYSDLGGTQLVGTTTYANDADANVTAITTLNGVGTTLASFDYAYNSANELLSETDNGGTPTTYSYDPSGQVTAVSGPLAGTSGTYSYDANGNTAAAGATVGPDNELIFDGTWTYTYDTEGNEAGKTDGTDTWAYKYDNKNEMTSAVETTTAGTVQAIQYGYDAFGNRIEQVVTTYSYPGSSSSTTATTNYALDGWNPAQAGATGLANFSVWADLDAMDHLQSRYIVGDQVDQLIARIDQIAATPPALGFGGDSSSSNGGVNLAQTNLTNSNVTVSVWVKLDTYGGTFFENTYDSGVNGVMLGSDSSNGKVQFVLGNGTSETLESNTVLELGEWYLVSATYDGGTMKIYINGVLDNSLSYGGGISYISTIASIGYDRSNSTSFVDGELADVRVYSSAVSISGIQQLYNGGYLYTSAGVESLSCARLPDVAGQFENSRL